MTTPGRAGREPEVRPTASAIAARVRPIRAVASAPTLRIALLVAIAVGTAIACGPGGDGGVGVEVAGDAERGVEGTGSGIETAATTVQGSGSSDGADPAGESGSGESGASGRSGSGAASIASALRFEDVTAASGVDFTHAAGYTPSRYAPEIMGPGVAIVDVDRDGDPDLYAVNGGEVDAAARPTAAGDRLYLNDGAGGFTDVTESWGVVSSRYGMGVAAGDVDGDGWTDLFLTSYGRGERLLRNTGAGFEDITLVSGIDNGGAWSTSAGFFDVDLDGDLDLWVTNYTDYQVESALPCYANGVHVYCTPELNAGQPNVIWINDGRGRFRPSAAVAEPPDSPPTRGLALVLADIDTDGDVDAYVANDLDRNELWLNDGFGALTEVGRLRGVAYSATGAEEAGMGTDITDIDMDGRLEVVSANFQGETLSVYRQGDGMLFREMSDAIGIGVTARARLKWGLDFFDADNDGDEDLYVANGHLYDNVETFSADEGFAQPNSVYERLGDGTFLDVSAVAGPALADRRSSRGLATGDLDGDGLIDVVVGNNGGAFQIARNETSGAGHWLGFWLEGAGPRSNRDAIGARVVVRVRVDGGAVGQVNGDGEAGATSESTDDGDRAVGAVGGDGEVGGTGEAGRDGAVGGVRRIERQITGASSYLSVNDRRVLVGIGAGGIEAVESIEIHWPGGDVQPVDLPAADAWYHIRQGGSAERFVPGESVIAPSPDGS